MLYHDLLFSLSRNLQEDPPWRATNIMQHSYINKWNDIWVMKKKELKKKNCDVWLKKNTCNDRNHKEEDALLGSSWNNQCDCGEVIGNSCCEVACKQRNEESWMQEANMFDCLLVISFQKCCTGGQRQIAHKKSSKVIREQSEQVFDCEKLIWDRFESRSWQQVWLIDISPILCSGEKSKGLGCWVVFACNIENLSCSYGCLKFCFILTSGVTTDLTRRHRRNDSVPVCHIS